MAIQIPWIGICFALAWADQGEFDKLPGATMILWTFIMLPTIVALACGAYSLKVAGISWRNSCGVLGLLIGLATATWFLWKWLGSY